jgi:hypothetical protein
MLCGVCSLKVRVVGNVLLKCRCGSKGTSWLYMVRVVGAVDVGRGGMCVLVLAVYSCCFCGSTELLIC